MFKEYSEKHHEKLPALTIIQGGGTILREESDRNLNPTPTPIPINRLTISKLGNGFLNAVPILPIKAVIFADISPGIDRYNHAILFAAYPVIIYGMLCVAPLDFNLINNNAKNFCSLIRFFIYRTMS